MLETILDRLAKRAPRIIQDEETLLSKKTRRAFSSIKYRQKSGKKRYETRGGLYSMGARGVFVKNGGIYSRRVIVKAKIVKNMDHSFRERLREHLKYIVRNDAGLHGNKPEILSSHQEYIQIKNIEKKFSEAPHNFRFIVSPEDGEKIDLKDFTMSLINSIEKDLQTKLDWVAAIHQDTNDPHIHLLVNGKDQDGQRLLMTRDYISNGIRNRASETINKKLGLRDLDEIIKNLSIELNSDKKISIDEIIKKNIVDEQFCLKRIDPETLQEIPASLYERRLAHIENRGLAKRDGDQSWQIKKDYGESLIAIYRTRTIIDRLSSTLDVDKDSCTTIRPSDLSDKTIEGHVLKRGFVDELSSEEYLLIKGRDQKYYYVELERYSEKSAANLGELVRIENTKSFSGPKISDHTIEREARANGGIYDARKHEKSAELSISLPPGVSPREYAKVHENRLRVLARKGLAEDLSEGQYRIPKDYLEKISAEAKRSQESYKPHIKVTRIAPPDPQTLKLKNGLKPC